MANVLRAAIVAHIQKSSGEQTADQITKGIALAGLVAQELPGLIASGALQKTPTGGYTSKASVAAQLATAEASAQTLRLQLMDEADADAAPAAPAGPTVAPQPLPIAAH